MLNHAVEYYPRSYSVSNHRLSKECQRKNGPGKTEAAASTGSASSLLRGGSEDGGGAAFSRIFQKTNSTGRSGFVRRLRRRCREERPKACRCAREDSSDAIRRDWPRWRF